MLTLLLITAVVTTYLVMTLDPREGEFAPIKITDRTGRSQ